VVEVPLQVEVVRGDDPANVVDRSDSPLLGVPLVDLSWIDFKEVGISSSYKSEASVSKFLDECPSLKAGGHSSFFSVVPCSSTENVCLGRSGTGPPFCYMYTCLFADLHVSLPFDKFTMGVLRALNVAPTQIHPNTGHPFRPFACCATSFAFTLLPLLFFLIIPLTPPNLFPDTP